MAVAGSCSYGAKSGRAAKSVPRMPRCRRIGVEWVCWLPRPAGAVDAGVLHFHVGEDSAA